MKISQVQDALIKLGITPNLNGFKYICEGIMLLDDPKYKDFKWKSFYQNIAEKYDTTYSRVERSIRHAFQIARDVKTDYETVNHYIGFSNCSNSASLSILYLMLKREENNDNN